MNDIPRLRPVAEIIDTPNKFFLFMSHFQVYTDIAFHMASLCRNLGMLIREEVPPISFAHPHDSHTHDGRPILRSCDRFLYNYQQGIEYFISLRTSIRPVFDIFEPHFIATPKSENRNIAAEFHRNFESR